MKTKQQIRDEFRQSVFKRDNYRCKCCNETGDLDAHHITDRHLMPNGGYVKENGISLCPKCHLLAEKFHMTNGKEWEPHMHPNDLYELIHSSQELAEKISEKLK